jgi:hypothetical protein
MINEGRHHASCQFVNAKERRATFVDSNSSLSEAALVNHHELIQNIREENTLTRLRISHWQNYRFSIPENIMGDELDWMKSKIIEHELAKRASRSK